MAVFHLLPSGRLNCREWIALGLMGNRCAGDCSALLCMLVSVVTSSAAPLLVSVSGAAHFPFLFTAGMQAGGLFGCLIFLLARHRPLLCDPRVRGVLLGSVLRLDRRAIWFLLGTVSGLDYALFAWSSRHVDVAVTMVLFETWPLFPGFSDGSALPRSGSIPEAHSCPGVAAGSGFRRVWSGGVQPARRSGWAFRIRRPSSDSRGWFGPAGCFGHFSLGLPFPLGFCDVGRSCSLSWCLRGWCFPGAVRRGCGDGGERCFLHLHECGHRVWRWGVVVIHPGDGWFFGRHPNLLSGQPRLAGGQPSDIQPWGQCVGICSSPFGPGAALGFLQG